MPAYTVHEAKTHLSKLIERGEEVVIARGDKPVVKLTAVERNSVKSKKVTRAIRSGCRLAGTPMKLLLDTHTLIWWFAGSPLFSKKALEAFGVPIFWQASCQGHAWHGYTAMPQAPLLAIV